MQVADWGLINQVARLLSHVKATDLLEVNEWTGFSRHLILARIYIPTIVLPLNGPHTALTRRGPAPRV